MFEHTIPKKTGKNFEKIHWLEKEEATIRTIAELEKHIYIKPEEKKYLSEVIRIHPMSVTPYYLSLIDPDDVDDPIRKLIIPSIEELNPKGTYDTSGERENTILPGLQHKYRETALLLATNQCAAYCRFCFRKRLVGLPTREISQRFQDAATYISQHEEINNILISGGDPFLLSNSLIENLLETLDYIDHLKFIRFGTRMPVVYPYRFIENDTLLDLLSEFSKETRRIYIVTHFNHPREITDLAIDAISSLLDTGVIINNQTVLLKGVNDNSEVISDLMNNLTAIGVNPYYLFQCRPVSRVRNHFQVPLKRGYRIVGNAQKRLNGHAKRFKYVMSHQTGKIEIVGIMEDEIYFRYLQATQQENIGRLFKKQLTENAGWLDDLK